MFRTTYCETRACPGNLETFDVMCDQHQCLVWETVINCTANARSNNVGNLTQELVFPDSSDVIENRTVECYFGDEDGEL